MRWFRGHSEAPRLLRLSPLRADEDVNETSYHLDARSRCRGKSRLKWRRIIHSHWKSKVRSVIRRFSRPILPVHSRERERERIGPIFAKMSCRRCVPRVHTRVFACRSQPCAWQDWVGIPSCECEDYDSTFRQAEVPRVTGWKARIEANWHYADLRECTLI